MDISIILTGVGTVVAVVGANIALISWLRTDMKAFETEMKTDMKTFETKIEGWKDEIGKQMTDFHTKLALQDQDYKNHLLHYHKQEIK